MRWYTVPGWPAGLLGHSAATPALVRPPGSAHQYKDGVYGYPGTKAVPMTPRSSATVPGGGAASSPAQAMMGFSRTQDAPDAIYPNQYWARPQNGYWPGAGLPVSIYSDNLMPVPATDPRAVPAVLAVPVDSRRVQGYTGGTISQPANLVMWPRINT